MSLVEWIDFRVIRDHRGSLVAIEEGRTVPLEIRRVCYHFSTQTGISRGFHAHRVLRQVVICLSGSCRVILDDGGLRQEVMLDRPDRGLLILEMIWHEMHDFSPDCVLLVLANAHYDEADYLRDYDVFLRLIMGEKAV